MKYLALPCALLLAACAAVQPGASGTGTSTGQETAPGGVATIRWVVSDSPTEDCAAASKTRKTIFTSRGCSSWNDRAAIRECSIIAPMPRHERDFERIATLGHEFWHCLYGNWHDDYGNAHPVASAKGRK